MTVLQTLGLNKDQPWDEFESLWYLKHNYAKLRSDDRLLIEWIGDFFAANAGGELGHGIDVGTGTNLYPALAVLPQCHTVTMVERSASNVRWLRSQVPHFAETWEPFWAELVGRQPDHYQRIRDPREALSWRGEVRQGNIFELDPHAYDLGTMFFVAESITARQAEFEKATTGFLQSLRRHAPFAAAFMKGSSGYQVGSYRFPAVAIDENDINRLLAPIAYDIRVRVIPTGGSPLRDGYEGMILATGRAGRR